MRNVKRMLMTACVTLMAGGAFAAAPEVTAAGGGRLVRVAQPVQGEYIVMLKEKPGAGLPDIAQEAGAMASRYGAQVLYTYESAFRGFLVSANEAQALKLAEHPLVEFVQENGYVEPAGTQSPAPWNLDRIDQPGLPLNNAYTTDAATGINVYVVDSGIRLSHQEFEGRAKNVYNYFSTESNTDCMGHGTRTAAIIGGKTWGVAKKVTLNSVRVVNCSSQATSASIAGGLDWVAQNAVTPAVVNLSFATGTPDSTIEAAAQAVLNRSGLVLVAAVGNAGVDACNSSPARIPGVVAVGATDQSDFRWYRSNYGSCLDLFAPGVEIPSAAHTDDVGATYSDGTSWAAPHVAGVAAVMMANNVSAANIPTTLVNDSSKNVVGDPGMGSPNQFLYKKPFATVLTNGVAMSVSDSTGGIKNFVLNVPSGRSSLTFSISGGTGDADLYVRYGNIPETYVFDCRPLRAGNNETCTFTNPAGGSWYVQLRAYSTYSTSLKGQY